MSTAQLGQPWTELLFLGEMVNSAERWSNHILGFRLYAANVVLTDADFWYQKEGVQIEESKIRTPLKAGSKEVAIKDPDAAGRKAGTPFHEKEEHRPGFYLQSTPLVIGDYSIKGHDTESSRNEKKCRVAKEDAPRP